MVMLKLAVAAAAIIGLCNGAPPPATHRLHEKRHNADILYRKSTRVHPDAIIPLKIGLTQTHLEDGYDFLMDVSHPDSPNYGKHWTAQEVHDKFAPTDAAIEAVKAWLVSSGIKEDDIIHYENKGWLSLHLPASKAEELFATEYHEHEHMHTGSMSIGCDEYHVPHHISEHIDFITPGVKLSAPLKRSVLNKRSNPAFRQGPMKIAVDTSSYIQPPGARLLAANLRDCAANFTPPCMKALYGIPDATTATPGNELGLYEDGDTFSQDDINEFFSLYAPNVPQGTTPIHNFVDGAQAPVDQMSQYNTGESDIDMDIIYSLIYPQQIILYQTDDRHYSTLEGQEKILGFLNTFLDALDGSYCDYSAYGITGNSPGLDPKYPDPTAGGYKGKLQCGVYKPAHVISGSYGQAEYDLPANYTKRQCNEFMKLGLQGHSIFFSSGDYGVSSFPTDLKVCLGKNGRIFNPNYPVGCPYITAVGATQLNPNDTILDPESALHQNLGGSASNFSSAGGFSNYFSRPSYQDSAVLNYFQIAKPTYPYYQNGNVGANGGIYNRNGRGIPDVSSNGANYRAFNQGTDYHFYGTSLAAPTWASITNMINEKRLAAGKRPVGFVNPVLYQNPNVLNDITKGTNPGCGTLGFKASKGWDPITGLGTPNYSEVENLFLSLP